MTNKLHCGRVEGDLVACASPKAVVVREKETAKVLAHLHGTCLQRGVEENSARVFFPKGKMRVGAKGKGKGRLTWGCVEIGACVRIAFASEMWVIGSDRPLIPVD